IAPVPPAKPAPIPRPTLAPPQFSSPPAKPRAAVIARVPLGPNERVARLAGLGSIFFAAFASLGAELGLEAAKYGAVWALITCAVVFALKQPRGRQERETRKEADQKARDAEKDRVEKAHNENMK